MMLLGIDPGLAACGVAVVELNGAGVHVLGLEVVRTTPSPKSRRLRAADDLCDRVRTIARLLHDRLQVLEHVVAVCVEAQAIPFRGGRMMVKPSGVAALGRVRGLVDAYAVARSLPIVEETPQVLKLLATGRKDASKADVAEALQRRFPEVSAMWPAQKTLQEHAADALAAVVAGLESDLIRAALRVGGQP